MPRHRPRAGAAPAPRPGEAAAAAARVARGGAVLLPGPSLAQHREICSSTMFLVGLSGGIASGKSTVVAVLRELGCAVIDADVIAREVVQPHFKAYQQIVHYFGPEILLENGEINREALGNIIFSCPEKRQLLNSITHPEIQKEMLKQILKYFVLGYRYVILDIPLLFETKRLTKFMKYTVLVYCIILPSWQRPADAAISADEEEWAVPGGGRSSHRLPAATGREAQIS
ncbi:dephospho-CoA kinase domain-containing protein isoform X3 [Falco biarmicus]|uniref:dephospho-CoA kinase domain-containing protein isoform X3 n=1 Tax=Falco biarmicus TaxID=345155 RepID=UPI0024BD1E08|nr:dephospho-CoA kinase domain-containing protein isoform X3 [Falco biarmicus]